MPKNILLYDPWGQPIQMVERPPAVRLADVGRVRDPFSSKALGQITAELMARVLKPTARLTDVMYVAQKMLDDDHLFATLRRLVFSISRLPIETKPVDDSAEAKKDAADAKVFLDGLPSKGALVRWLVFGEYYPISGAETIWNDDYGVSGFTPVDPLRWYFDDITNAFRLLTIDAPATGIELPEHGFILHSSRLEPGPVRRSGLWRKCAWLWLFKNFTWDELMKFVELYGNPQRWAFYELPEQEESVKLALQEMGANYAGVFPKGVEVKFAEAQRYGTLNLHETVVTLCNKGMTKVVNGHDLDAESAPDSGKLAGGHASDVQQEIKEGVSEGVGDTLRERLLRPWFLFQRGADFVNANRTPHVTVIASKPVDQIVRGQVFISANTALARAGKIVDPAQIESELSIRTIDVAPVEPTPAEDANAQNAAAATAGAEQRQAAKQTIVAAAKPKIRTLDDLIRATTLLGAKANTEDAQHILDMLNRAEDLVAFRDMLFEEYDSFDTTKVAEVFAQAMAVARAIGQGDGAEGGGTA